jgi:hypothetical protein
MEWWLQLYTIRDIKWVELYSHQKFYLYYNNCHLSMSCPVSHLPRGKTCGRGMRITCHVTWHVDMVCESLALCLLTWSKLVCNNLFAKGAKIIGVQHLKFVRKLKIQFSLYLINFNKIFIYIFFFTIKYYHFSKKKITRGAYICTLTFWDVSIISTFSNNFSNF